MFKLQTGKIHTSMMSVILVSILLCFTTAVKLVSAQDIQQTQGEQIVFAANKDGDFDIYLMDINGVILGQLTDNNAVDISPNWSPDGSKVAFASNVDGDYDIYVIDMASGKSTNLTNNSWDDIAPVWSPDGKQIAFSSNQNTNWDLYVMDANGKNLERLTSDTVSEAYPSWSPDGKQLVYVQGKDAARDIMVLDIASGDQEPLTTLSTSADYSPTWSPNGDQIAFVSSRSGNADIFVVDTSCIGNSDQCDATATNLTADNGTNTDWDPAWSPDGKQIMFASAGTDNAELYTIDLESGDITQFTKTNYDNRFPAWWGEVQTGN